MPGDDDADESSEEHREINDTAKDVDLIALMV
jgi:hypothetical protein